MKIIRIICIAIIFQINVSLLTNNEPEMKYTNDSYFTAIGITGEGKSSFLNILSGKNKFSISSKGNSETQTVQHVSFSFNGTSFVAIDTPGLDDSVDNSKKIKDLKRLISVYPTLKCLLIVKKYNNFRLSLSIQESIKVFMEAFPKKNFWDHVIVINTFSNPNDESFREYFENEKEFFLDKIINCRNIRELMEKKNIEMPKNITEYFIDNKHNKRMSKIFNEIKNDIANHELMFKKVEIGEKDVKIENTLIKGRFKVTIYRNITCTDFKDNKKIITDIISVFEESLSEKNKIRSEIEKIYLGADSFHLLDYITFSLYYWFRAHSKYQIDEWDYHKIGNREFKHQKTPTKYIME